MSKSRKAAISIVSPDFRDTSLLVVMAPLRDWGGAF